MHAAYPNSIDRSASASPTRNHVLVDDLIDQLAADFVSLNAEGAATMERLCQLGWAPSFIEANGTEAQARANRRFVRQIEDDPAKTARSVQDDMSDVIASLLPSTQLVVAELQARGFNQRHIELFLPKAKARAAYGFCHGMSVGAY